MRGKSVDLSKLLERITKQLGSSDPMAARNIKVAMTWDAVAGEMVASHTADAHLRQGEFIVYVDSPVWAHDLSSMSELYRNELNAAFGKEIVKSVRFEVSRRPHRKRVELAQDNQPDTPRIDPVPLSEMELQMVEESTSVIPDDKLRQSILRATIAHLEWEKGTKSSKTP